MRKHFLILLTCLFLICSMIGCSSRETASREENTETAKGYLGQQVRVDMEESKMVIADALGGINGINVKKIEIGIWKIRDEEDRIATINGIIADVDQAAAGEAYDMRDWEKAYVEYLASEERGYSYSYSYSLIYVNDDEIPELAINYHVMHSYTILTFHDGVIDELNTWTIYYVERQNLVNGTYFHMGGHSNEICSIENGKWVHVETGNWSEAYGEGEYYEAASYEWEGEEVDERTYMERLNSAIDLEKQIEPKYISFEKILYQLKTGKIPE